jgi:predicted nuclease with TOPRIM domain
MDAGACALHFVLYKVTATVRIIDMAESIDEVVKEVEQLKKESEERKKLLAETKERMKEWGKFE